MLSTMQVQERRAAFVARLRTWEDTVGIGGFFGLCAVALAIMWFTRHSRDLAPMLVSMALVAIGLAAFLVLLPRGGRRTRPLQATLLVELGLVCPACGTGFVNKRGEVVLRRGTCPCGEQILQPEDPTWRASLPTLDQLGWAAFRYNISLALLFLIFFAGPIAALMLIDAGKVSGTRAIAYLGVPIVILAGLVYQVWKRIHRWVGAACGVCGEALVGGKGEPSAGIAESTKSCPACGASVVR
jgi:hypothetical protein